MSLKKMIVISIIWLVFCISVAIGIGFIFIHGKLNAAERGRQLGQGVGVITGIGFAILWLPWASKKGKARREAIEQKRRRRRKRRG